MSLSFPPSPTVGQEYGNWVWNGQSWDAVTNNGPTGPVLQGYIDGFIGVPSASSIAWGPGQCSDNLGASLIVGAAITKTTGAFAAGNNNGGLAVGTIAAATWYYAFAAIINGVFDVFYDVSQTGANAPAGTTALRRIWSWRTEPAATTVRPYLQNGDECLWMTPFLEFSAIGQGSTQTTRQLVFVPPMKVLGQFSVSFVSDTLANILNFWDPDLNAQTASYSAGGGGQVRNTAVNIANATNFTCRTNALGQINSISNTFTSTQNFYLLTLGYVDMRGRQGSVSGTPTNPFPRNFIDGFQSVWNSTTSISWGAGQCFNSTNATVIVGAAITKTTAAFAAGNNNGGLASGVTLTNGMWLYVFAAIINGSYDVFYDSDAAAAHAPSGTTAFRRIWSFKLTVGATTIRQYVQWGEQFVWAPSIVDITGAIATGVGAAITVGSIPPAFPVEAGFRGFLTATNAGTTIGFYSPDEVPIASYDIYMTATGTGLYLNRRVRSKAGQIWGAANLGGTSSSLYAYDFWDRRGRDS